MLGAVGAVTAMVTGCAVVVVTQSGDSSSPGPVATTAIHSFFDRYVDPDGRVVRHDQGGDTVSEGQSYALLLAAITSDRSRFDQVWTWTTTHLQRDDGLFSWRYVNGSVADPMSATDADVQTAWALTLAARRFAPEPYTSQARSLATAILDHESVIAGGHRYLTAGPWANNDPAVLNPSYAVPQALVELSHVTGDPRWSDLAASSRSFANGLRAQTALPPDWVRLDLATGHADPIAAPGGSADPPTFGLDAARLVAWSAMDCDPSSRSNAAAWVTTLDDHPSVQRHELSGEPVGTDESAASVSTTAVAELAAGDQQHADSLFADARHFDEKHPTYYGAAWVALALSLAEPNTALTCTPG